MVQGDIPPQTVCPPVPFQLPDKSQLKKLRIKRSFELIGYVGMQVFHYERFRFFNQLVDNCALI